MSAFLHWFYILVSMKSLNNYVKNIKEMRLKKGLTQAQVAQVIGVSRPTYTAIEAGKQKLDVEEAQKLANLFGLGVEELLSGAIPNYEKYKQMILAFLRKSGKIPKTKLAKLVYLADAGWYYYHLQSMSGMSYRKIKYGPVADPYFRIIDELCEDGQIEIEQTADGAMLIFQTRAGAKESLSEIKKEEAELIDNIGEKWKNKKTREIVEFTHNQLPYLCAGDNEIITIGLITQEDPHEYY